MNENSQNEQIDVGASLLIEQSESNPKEQTPWYKKIFCWKTATLFLSCICLVAAILFVVQCGKIVRPIDRQLDKLKNIAALPDDMRDLSFSSRLTLIHDSYNHNWEKYNRQAVENMKNHGAHQSNYMHTAGIWIMIENVAEYQSECQLMAAMRRERYDNVYKGTMELIMDFPKVPEQELAFVIYDMYQVQHDTFSDVYINLNEQWYHAVLNNDEDSVLNIVPEECLSWFSNELSIAEPLRDCIVLPSDTLDNIYPYSLFKSPYCANSLAGADILEEDNHFRVGRVSREGSPLSINFSELNKNMDSVLTHVLNKYYSTTGGTTNIFSEYGHVEEIVIPDEVLSAQELTPEIKKLWSDELVSFIDSTMDNTMEAILND